VGDVMTRSVLCVSPRLPLVSVAIVLDEHRIRCVPVVDLGRLVGIGSRGDLIKALARLPVRPGKPRSDAELVREVKDRLAAEPWASAHSIVAHANHGVLALWGPVESEAEKGCGRDFDADVSSVKSHLMVRPEVPYLYGA
jgi:CBS domain-containing protein